MKPPKCAEIGENSPSEPLPDAGEACWELPRALFDTQPELAAEYAAVKLGIEEKILAGMQRSETVSEGEIDTVKKRIAYFKGDVL